VSVPDLRKDGRGLTHRSTAELDGGAGLHVRVSFVILHATPHFRTSGMFGAPVSVTPTLKIVV